MRSGDPAVAQETTGKLASCSLRLLFIRTESDEDSKATLSTPDAPDAPEVFASERTDEVTLSRSDRTHDFTAASKLLPPSLPVAVPVPVPVPVPAAPPELLLLQPGRDF